MSKTILVTGGAGFIGSNFIHYLYEKYDNNVNIINMDSLTYAGNLENLKDIANKENYTFINGDICDKDLVSKVLIEYPIDTVINFAAESHVDRSILDPDIFAKTNILGTLNLLNCCKKKWTNNDGSIDQSKRFLQVSTDEVYGSLGSDGFFTEVTPLNPRSPYSSSKTSADLFCISYYETYDMPIIITRCSNNYGPYQFPEKLIPLMIHNAMLLKNLPIYGDGLNIRDWLHVKDHCRAIDMVENDGKLGEVYNIGGHNERTNVFIVKRIIKSLAEKYDTQINEDLISYVEDRKGHDRRYGINPKKIDEELGWKPSIMFEEGIEMTIDWYLNNQEWVAGVTSGAYKDYYSTMYGK